jgi:pyruvate/2-oxoglutarate/acetoin dehydrogenase E1 component
VGVVKSAFLALVKERVMRGTSWLVGFEVSRHGLGGGGPHPRIVDLPICEETMMGLAVGLQRAGAEVFVDLMFDVFALRCFDVLVNQVAITRLLQPCPTGRVVVRALAGPFEGAGPQHGGGAVATLARLPHVNVAVPVCDDDVGWANAAFGVTPAPGFLIMPAASPVDPTGHVEGEGRTQLRRFGMGIALGVVVLGPFLHLVLRAVRGAEATASVTVVAPLFLAPLPVAAVAASVAHCARILIIDAAPPPVGLASELRGAFPTTQVRIAMAVPDLTVHHYQTSAQVAAIVAELRGALGARQEN